MQTMMMTLSFVLIPLLLPSLEGGENEEDRPLQVVPSVDLVRYSGTWYEIARLPNRFQTQCVGDVTATYTLLDDGAIKVVNACLNEDGEIESVEGRARRKSEDEPNSKLEVRFAPAFLSFLPFVWGNYWIIDLDTEYTYAVVGEPNRKYLWILARSPNMNKDLYDQILSRIKAQGYDTSRLIRTQHQESP
jgi:apolipoprotein D and lipocalin family protein